MPPPPPPATAAVPLANVVAPPPPAAAGAPPESQDWQDYALPLDGILESYSAVVDEDDEREANDKKAILEATLEEFKVSAKVTRIVKGPVVTMFEVMPAYGVKIAKIVQLEDNIALRLAAQTMRIIAPIPGKEAVGIEVPNKQRVLVGFRELVEDAQSARIQEAAALPIYLGKNITGEVVTADLAAMPHLLVAGATGSGKSVCVNTMILSLLYRLSPAECRMILIDPKIVELKLYNGIPHLLSPVITDPESALRAMRYCVREMERRYDSLDRMSARSIKTYNKSAAEKGIERMPYLVVIIDEFADLMAASGKELEAAIARLAAMSRAVGIHLVLATQRPSADVITGLIKSNIPARIAFMVASMTDSRVIIDTPGAEKLLGKGDMLYSSIESPFPVRAQGAYVCEDEVEKVVAALKTLGKPAYVDIGLGEGR
jgi:S-DNA-T family DNA segregation ATPase FtsK/SpoIIIE